MADMGQMMWQSFMCPRWGLQATNCSI